MSKRIPFLAVLALGVALIASPAMARGFYVGGSIGQTSSDINGLGDMDLGAMGSVDDTDTGFKVFGGYNFMKFFSVEASWVDVAGPSAEASIPATTVTPATNVSVSTDANGLSFEAMGVLPLGTRFELFAEAGFLMWDGNVTASGFGESFSGSNDGTDPTFGLGFGWNVIQRGQLRFEAERYAMEDLDVDMYSTGFSYRF